MIIIAKNHWPNNWLNNRILLQNFLIKNVGVYAREVQLNSECRNVVSDKKNLNVVSELIKYFNPD